MKKSLFVFTGILFFSLSMISCSNEDSKGNEVSQDIMDTSEEGINSENKETLVNQIDSVRTALEANLKSLKMDQISTEGMRPQISQKWSKIHFYSQNGKVVRIKTYPHESISKRTEEFYFDEGNLVLVAIEDDGEGEKGKPKSRIDKMYYFHNDEFIHEEKNAMEAEFKIRDSDNERVLQEAKEYLEIFKNMKK